MAQSVSMVLMMPDVKVWLGEVFAFFSPFGTDSRLHWTGLSAFFMLGTFVYLRERRRAGRTSENWFRFLFPKTMYTSPSTLVDVKVYLGNRFFKPVISMLTVPVSAMVMAATASLIVPPETDLSSPSAGIGTIIAATICVVILADFAYYITHRWSHESELLWPFHKLHHTAEVLTPITAKRNHPVFDLLLRFVTIAAVAPLSGIVFGLFGIFEFSTIFGLSLLIAMMNFAGGALRHSHVWLDYGPVLDRIFISPAQHQVHHSCAVKHHDKNYGMTLAIWDWMFGTLYVPSEQEILEFGVADREGRRLPQVHNTLKEAYLVPFTECTEILQSRASLPPQKEA